MTSVFNRAEVDRPAVILGSVAVVLSILVATQVLGIELTGIASLLTGIATIVLALVTRTVARGTIALEHRQRFAVQTTVRPLLADVPPWFEGSGETQVVYDQQLMSPSAFDLDAPWTDHGIFAEERRNLCCSFPCAAQHW